MSISSIRKRVEEEVFRRLPSALLQWGVAYHTRKGTRQDCDCPYCTYKKEHRHWGFYFGENDDSTTRKYVFEQYTRPKFRHELWNRKELL